MPGIAGVHLLEADHRRMTMTVLFLIIAVALLIASYWRGALIGPGLASVVVAVYLWPHWVDL